MGLEEIVKGSEALLGNAVSKIHSSIDSLVGFGSNHNFIGSFAVASAAAIAGYAASMIFQPGQAGFLALSSAYISGALSFFYFKDECSLRKLGLSRSDLRKRESKFYKHADRTFFEQVWDSPFDYPGSWSFIPAVYEAVVNSPVQGVIFYLGSYAILKSVKAFLNSEFLFPLVRGNYARIKSQIMKDPNIYASALEEIVKKSPFSLHRIDLIRAYSSLGMHEEAYMQSKLLKDNLFISKSNPLLSNRLIFVISGYYREVERKTTNIDPYLYLASILDAVGSEKASDCIELMVERIESVEASLLAFWHYHGKHEIDRMRHHLGNSLRLLYEQRLPVEQLDGGSGSKVFRFSPKHLRDDFVIRVGNLEELVFEAERTREAFEAVGNSSYYFASEPLFVGPIGDENLFVMTLLRGETLYDCLVAGTSGMEDLLGSWNLTRLIHEGVDKSLYGKGFLSASEKIRAVANDVPEKARNLLLEFAEPIDYCRRDAVIVFNTDGHPKNRIKSGSRMGIIDLQPKGSVVLEYEAANYRYVVSEQLREKESEFVFLSGINPLRYLLEALLKDLSLSRSKNKIFAQERIQDASYAVAQIKDGFPMYYARFNDNFRRGVEGLAIIEERMAA